VKYQKLKMLISRLKIKISNKNQRLSTDNALENMEKLENIKRKHFQKNLCFRKFKKAEFLENYKIAFTFKN